MVTRRVQGQNASKGRGAFCSPARSSPSCCLIPTACPAPLSSFSSGVFPSGHFSFQRSADLSEMQPLPVIPRIPSLPSPATLSPTQSQPMPLPAHPSPAAPICPPGELLLRDPAGDQVLSEAVPALDPWQTESLPRWCSRSVCLSVPVVWGGSWVVWCWPRLPPTPPEMRMVQIEVCLEPEIPADFIDLVKRM